MSFLVGSLAGAVVTGGVYYGFSNLIQARTDRHRNDLHHLSGCFTTVTPATNVGPLPASARIVERPFVTMVQARWNAHIANAFSTVGQWERQASDRVRRVLYGES